MENTIGISNEQHTKSYDGGFLSCYLAVQISGISIRGNIERPFLPTVFVRLHIPTLLPYKIPDLTNLFRLDQFLD